MRTIPFGKPLLGDPEKAALCAVLDSGILVHGERIHQFEHDFAVYTGAPHAVGVANCTAGLHLCYVALGIGPGDEVIVPAQTHVATAHAVELVGAKPVFCDAEPLTGNLDLDLLSALITPRTKAISCVHFLGMPVDMPRLMKIAQQHGLKVIEDCALALGARVQGIHCGLWGDAGCFSFYPVKHITTSEGGMVITRDATLATTIERQRAFGLDRMVNERKIAGLYDVTRLGFNYRMSELEAALGVCQLQRQPGMLAARAANHAALTAGLAGTPGLTMLRSTHGEFLSSYYCHSILLDPALAPRRFDMIAALKARGIGTSIYYPSAVPLFTYYRQKYGYQTGQFPNAERISNHSIALPVGPHLTAEDLAAIIAAVKTSIKEITP